MVPNLPFFMSIKMHFLHLSHIHFILILYKNNRSISFSGHKYYFIKIGSNSFVRNGTIFRLNDTRRTCWPSYAARSGSPRNNGSDPGLPFPYFGYGSSDVYPLNIMWRHVCANNFSFVVAK